MLKFCFRRGMIVDKLHEIISFKLNGWLEKNKNFITQKRNQAVFNFEKELHNLQNNEYYGKNNRKCTDWMKNWSFFLKKNNDEEIIKQ